MIVFDSKNPRSVAAHNALLDLVDLGTLPDDLVVVLGGDGFMLHTVRRYGLDRVYLGLNTGHLGFLLNDIDSLEDIAERLHNQDWRVDSFPMLEARITGPAGDTVVHQAINDVYLERMTGQTARIDLSIDEVEVVRGLVADGIIFCTALGSTAYSFSAGGAPCHPMAPIIGVTPICPHLPRLPPFILPQSARARVHVRMHERRPVRVVLDGMAVDHVTEVQVASSVDQVRIARFRDRDLTTAMVHKVVRGAP